MSKPPKTTQRARPLATIVPTSKTLNLVVAALSILAWAPPSEAAVLTVGTNPVACDYTDVQQAIVAAADGDELHLQATGFAGSPNVNFNIVGKSLSILGGYTGCSTTRTMNPTTLSAQGNDSVLELRAGVDDTVILERLVITNGKDDGDYGGGIEIDGDYDVYLIDVDVVLNQSERGAGIHINGSSGASISLAFSRVGLNSASASGGGIYCENGAQVLLQVDTTIDQNSAQNDGGGLWSDDCLVKLYGYFYFHNPSVEIASNQALGHGGGIYVQGGSGLYAYGEEEGVVLIRNNTAGFGGSIGHGGGIYLKDSQTISELDRTRIEFNRAYQGGGIYATSNAEITMRMSGPCHNDFCSILNQNDAILGGALAITNQAFADIEATYFVSNGVPSGESGDAPIAFVGGGNLVVEGSVLAHHSGGIGGSTGGIIETAGSVSVAGSTFYTNGAGLDSLFWLAGSFSGQGLIFEGTQSGSLFHNQGASSWSLDCAVVPPGTTLPAGVSIVVFADPQLRDPSLGDYHLLENSPAIDLCGAVNIGIDHDLDFDPRPIGIGYDAGSDEFDFPLFVDGFESGNTSQWSSTVP